MTDKHVVVGVSEKVAREKRFTAIDRLVVVDWETMTLERMANLDFSDLPHNIGNTNEIRYLSEQDYAHRGRTVPRIDWAATRLADGDLRYRLYTGLRSTLKRFRWVRALRRFFR